MLENRINYKEVTDIAYRVASRYIYDKDSAKDIAQLTAIECFINAEKLREESLNSWIYVAAKHKSIDYIKRKKKERGLEDSKIESIEDNIEKDIQANEDLNMLIENTPNKIVSIKQKQFLEMILKNKYDFKLIGSLPTLPTRMVSIDKDKIPEALLDKLKHGHDGLPILSQKELEEKLTECKGIVDIVYEEKD